MNHSKKWIRERLMGIGLGATAAHNNKHKMIGKFSFFGPKRKRAWDLNCPGCRAVKDYEEIRLWLDTPILKTKKYYVTEA
jgi:hypothetical protein